MINMRLLLIFTCLLVIFHCSYAPPVDKEKDKSKEHDSEIKDNLEDVMEYHRYLQEVVQALESDADFRERLEKANEEDVRSGKIAEQLDFVNHNVRTKLDEIKRRELERLRHLATREYELTNDIDTHMGKVPSNEHLDHANRHTFEIEDLRKLIKKTTADLEAADRQRKEEFKEYEMQKEFEKHQKIEAMDETHKKEYMEKLKAEEEAKKHHEPLHHPGSKQQLEEVWEKQDHMDQQFDPKAFFMLHDVDGNGVWDADEVKALFIKELDKLYGPGTDLHERAEEMERMREHVFKENDRNRDGLIDFNEFMLGTQKSDFNQDEGWKGIDENQIYTQAEYEEYERRRLEELRYLQQRGLVDAHGRPVPGAEHQIHQIQQQAYQQQQAHHQQQAYQQQAYQQQYQQSPPQYQGQQQYYPQGQSQGQAPPYQQPPQGQFQAQQPPQGQFQAQQPPQGQFQAQQPPQGQFQAQQPPQGQFQAQQPPQGQFQGQQQSQGQFQGQQPPQAQFQAQQAPQGQYQAQQPPQGQFQAPQSSEGKSQQAPQGQYQGQGAQQPIQNVNLNQGQMPQVQQGQPPQQASLQGQQQPQSQVQQGQPTQTQNQVPPANVNANH